VKRKRCIISYIRSLYARQFRRSDFQRARECPFRSVDKREIPINNERQRVPAKLVFCGAATLIIHMERISVDYLAMMLEG